LTPKLVIFLHEIITFPYASKAVMIRGDKCKVRLYNFATSVIVFNKTNENKILSIQSLNKI